MRQLSLSKKDSCGARNFLAAGVFHSSGQGLGGGQGRPHMSFGRMFRRSFLAIGLGSLFVIGGMAQPASAAPRNAMHREMRNDRREVRRDVRMRNRMNRRIRRNSRQLRRSNGEFGRNSFRSRMLRRRLRRDLRQRRALNRDIRHDRRDRARA